MVALNANFFEINQAKSRSLRVTSVRMDAYIAVLFNLFRTYLLENGTDEQHIIALSLDDRKNRRLLDPDALLDYIDEHNPDDGKTTYAPLMCIKLSITPTKSSTSCTSSRITKSRSVQLPTSGIMDF